MAAFGYWAGYAGAAVSLKCWAAQQTGGIAGPVHVYGGSAELLSDLTSDLDGTGAERPTALIIGALGRVGTGAADLCTAMSVRKRQRDHRRRSGDRRRILYTET